MRQVRLSRNAFINASYCTAGSVVAIGDGVVLAPFMTEITPDATANHSVSVHYSEGSGEVDLIVDGVETRLDHTTFKLRMD